MNNKIKVAAYCRVSTDYEDQLNSLSTQIKYFTEYISTHDGWELIEVYYDEGITGTSVKKRDGFNRMIKDCENGKINLILTKEVSRFARNTVDTLCFTRKLSALGIGVIFMNDGIDTRDKDGELRLTIMASIAQEESRKVSERVKWGIRRKMENGFVYGYSRMYGFNIIDGKLEVIPDEAEVVKKIFNMYLYEGKGSTRIANELNAAGYFTSTGKIWRQDAVIRILKNDKYCGNLTQWKHCCTDFLSHKVVHNDGSYADMLLITIEDHHEQIISVEVFEQVQELLDKRGRLAREGRKFSQHYWYSSRVYCGKCGWAYGVTGRKSLENRCLRCVNRSKHGASHRIDANGADVGCDNKFITENVLKCGMKYILEHIKSSRDSIVSQLLTEIQLIQSETPAINTAPIQEEIDKLVKKKHKAIDMMLEELISKDDLKNQVEFYDDEIAKLTDKITKSQNIGAVHKQQLDSIKSYIKQVNQTSDISTDSTEIYGTLLKKITVHRDGLIDFELNCVPFTFRIYYHQKRLANARKFKVCIDNCEVIA